MKNRNLIAALFLGTVSAFAGANTASAHDTSCRAEVPQDWLKDHSISMCWQYPGADPAFHTLAEAMAGRRAIFAKFQGWTPGLVDAAVTATDGPSREVMIVKKNYFDDMAMGGMRVENGGVLADFKEMPKGITDQTGGLFLKARMWEFTFEGKVYRIFLPDICFNWADRLRSSAPPPPPPVTIHPQDNCVEIGVKMNAGDTLLFGIAANKELAPSWCTAQQKPGETKFEINFRIETCIDNCTLEAPAADLGKPLLRGPRETFTATQNGYYVVRLPKAVVDEEGVYDELFCLHRFDGHNSWGEYVASRNFTDGKAFIVYHREKTPTWWAGTALEWRFLPFAGEPNHR